MDVDGSRGSRKHNLLRKSGQADAPETSPIERRMRAALVADLGRLPAFVLHAGHCPAANVFRVFNDDFAAGLQPIVVAPQVGLDTYILDFLILMHGHGSTIGINVERDGHDCHERTKEQAARDKSRDRTLVRLGMRAMRAALRFTGSEIWRRADECAAEVREIPAVELHQQADATHAEWLRSHASRLHHAS